MLVSILLGTFTTNVLRAQRTPTVFGTKQYFPKEKIPSFIKHERHPLGVSKL